jgi:hypothetical protein
LKALGEIRRICTSGFSKPYISFQTIQAGKPILDVSFKPPNDCSDKLYVNSESGSRYIGDVIATGQAIKAAPKEVDNYNRYRERVRAKKEQEEAKKRERRYFYRKQLSVFENF